jgi:DNA-binding transcriptional LysR family regulator
MDTELLKTFLEVHQTRHFGRAAENLFLTQAAVSARIKQLESSLGGPVFTRYRNNLQLTETGRRLVPHAQSMLIAWDRAKQEVSLNSRNEVILGLGATNGLWDLFLQNVLHQSYEQNPEVILRAEAHKQDILLRRLLDRTMDLTFVYESAKHSDIKSVKLTQVELVLVTTKPSQITQNTELQKYVAIDWGTSFNIAFAKEFGNTPVILHTSLARIALEFLLRHNGCAYLPRQMVDEYLEETLYIVEDAPIMNRTIFACYHYESKYEQEIETLISISKTMLETQETVKWNSQY